MQKFLRLFFASVVAFACCERASLGFESNAARTFGNAPAFSGVPAPLRTLDSPSFEDGVRASNLSLRRVVPAPRLADEKDAPTSVFEEGDALLAQRRWFDAKKFFEKNLRSYPNDAALRDRFATARRRLEIDLRYRDSTFVELTNRTNYADVCAIFDEVFEQIDAYHVDAPSYSTLFAFGVAGLAETLDEEAFYLRNGIPLERREEARRFFAQIRETTDSWELQTEGDVRRAVLWTARRLSQKFGVPEAATASEFLCSAVCSLDAYSAYLTPAQVEDVFSMIDGRFVGLGVELKTDDPARIVRVIPNSPASESGVRAGDEIVAVDGTPTAGLSGGEVGALLQGVEGSRAELSLRGADAKLREIVAVRRQIEVPSVENVRVLDAPGRIGYVKIACFQRTTATELERAINELSRRDAECLVVDLRQNPGGLLQEAVDVSDLFLDSGTIVQTRGRNGARSYSARSRRACEIPLVLLIDSNSASASEIFAGAMQDNGRGLVVGTQSYGKGTVQAIVQLSTETRGPKPIAGLRLTTEKFYSPKGAAYGGVGVSPDVRVAEVETAEAAKTSVPSAPYAESAETNPIQNGSATVAVARPLVDEIADDPFLALAIREANRLVAARKAARPNASNVASRGGSQRFVGVSTGQF